MRVIAGEFKGRRLLSPRGVGTRPTSDRVREALFDVIAPKVEGALFLDAYAGTGAVGVEALSRGASRSVFVECDRGALQALRANLAALGIEDRATVLAEPFARAASNLAREKARFDLVFLDPPYGPGELLRALRHTEARDLLAPGGLVIAEHDTKFLVPALERTLRRARTLRYGGTALSLYDRG